MSSDPLLQFLEEVAAGRCAPVDAAASIESLVARRAPAGDTVAYTGEARVDLDRRRRCGYPEVVYAPGKTIEAIVGVFGRQRAEGQECFATRVALEQAAGVRAAFAEVRHNPVARTLRLSPPPGECEPHGIDSAGAEVGGDASRRPSRVVVVTAGTSDRPVAEEALETLGWMGVDSELIVDVGVAGPQRLLQQLPRLESARAVIVVAGMEGALPSVVGGWVSCPVVAVPTSVGYGASFGGLSALLGMLNSCASNVTVVNIDAGFKAGYIAGLIAQERRSQ